MWSWEGGKPGGLDSSDLQSTGGILSALKKRWEHRANGIYSLLSLETCTRVWVSRGLPICFEAEMETALEIEIEHEYPAVRDITCRTL